ncbi:magnesium transporter CorA family protein [Nonomuraea lactucae]|uniref:magnesium transporter CorA family protein n=1 Tax=Nonomuraea lactucae TaxID=2249762 RepID=UPI0019643E4F|nr:magnesium transporter CorA family protein [Nonomuraea lactucae]
MHTRLYRHGLLEKEGFPIGEVSDYVIDPDNVVWFDLCSPTREDLSLLEEELGLHELAVEDVVSDHQRPKVDIYDRHLFITVYGVHVDDGRLDPVEVNVFVTRNALVTVRENAHFDIRQVIRRWDAAGRTLGGHGVAFLLHGLLDYVVDGHLDFIDDLDEQIENLEDALFEEGEPVDGRALQRTIYELRRNAARFRKIVMPMREVVGTLLRRNEGMVAGTDIAPYYMDVYDHVIRVNEWIESTRDQLANLRETRLAQQGFRLNEIMKRLTGWAAIIAVPTLITGFYGMNVPYPGEGQSWGFWLSVVLISCISLGLYTAFKNRDWL